MNVRDFYEAAGGNYDELVKALGKEERVLKYLSKFPETNYLEPIKKSLDEKDYETAFGEVHNLKGISINIGLKKLYEVSSELTESLRHGPTGDVEGLYKKLAEEYDKTISMISQIDK